MAEDNNLLMTYSGELPQKRQVVFQVGIARETEVKTMHELMDKLRTVFERQFAFGEVEIHRLQLEQEMNLARDHVHRLAQVEENVSRDWETKGKHGPAKLNGNQEREKVQAYNNIEESKKRIARVKENIAACEAKIAG